jgi:hypothetical protein
MFRPPDIMPCNTPTGPAATTAVALLAGGQLPGAPPTAVAVPPGPNAGDGLDQASLVTGDLALPEAVTIAFGQTHYLTLSAGGTVDCAGECIAPVPDIAQGSTAVITAGNHFSVALLVTGVPVVWSGTEAQDSVPLCAAYGVIAIAAGDMHIMALRQDGRVCVW